MPKSIWRGGGEKEAGLAQATRGQATEGTHEQVARLRSAPESDKDSRKLSGGRAPALFGQN